MRFEFFENPNFIRPGLIQVPALLFGQIGELKGVETGVVECGAEADWGARGDVAIRPADGMVGGVDVLDASVAGLARRTEGAAGFVEQFEVDGTGGGIEIHGEGGRFIEERFRGKRA